MFAQNEQELFLSVITLGELRRGIVMLDADVRRAKLERWYSGFLVPRFTARLLPVTQEIAERWSALDGECTSRGNPLNAGDGLTAATALEYGMVVVTRNVKDFANLGVAIHNPFV